MGFEDARQVRRALTVEALPDSWKEYFQEKLNRLDVKSLLIEEKQRRTQILRKWARESDIEAHLACALSTRCNLIRARDSNAMAGDWRHPMPYNGHDLPAPQLRKDRNAVVLALLRIAVGLFFVVFGQYKVFGSGFVRSGFRDYVGGFIRDGAYPFMVPVLRWILAHAATSMSLAVGYGELPIGISLVIGLFSRVASLFGCALMLAMWLSGGYPGPHAAFWMYWGASLNWSVFAICFVVLAAGRTEEIASVRRMISAGSRPAKYSAKPVQTE